MTKFYYVARLPTGRKIKGYLQVEDENELIKILLKHDYKLIKYKKYKNKKQLFTFISVNKKDILSFCENINMMLKAGLTLKEAIHLTKDVVQKAEFKNVLIEIEKEISKGKSFYNAIANYPNIFPVFFRTMINLAEISGNLRSIFEHLISYYRFEISIKKKIVNTMFYPCLLLLLCFIVIIVISTVIVPSFVKIFTELKVDLPLMTKIIILISTFISNYFIYILIGSIILFICLMLYSKTQKGKYFIDKIKTKLIIYKNFFIINSTSKFCKCFKILIDSGIPVVTSIDICSTLINNLYIKEKFIFAIDEIKSGSTISQALFLLDFFPHLVIETIYISEKTANLSYSLDILGNIYEEEFHNRIQRLTTILEPALILFIAGVVIILIIAIFIPLFSMLNNIGGM
ncbi:MAG: type II secretion system F family protein [Erysipelotrichaceae bacterium]|nr:type II secretion system F family protein [Erysipelotrichaceae bacterium]